MKWRISSDACLWIGTTAVGVGRLYVPGHDLSWAGTYEAFAHLAVGWMLGLWWATRESRYLKAVGVVTVLEVVMFLMRKG